jgi:hypothetical protein
MEPSAVFLLEFLTGRLFDTHTMSLAHQRATGPN